MGARVRPPARLFGHLLAAVLVVVAVAGGALAGRVGWNEIREDIGKSFPDVPQLSAADLAAWLADEDRPAPLLLDVRDAKEFAVSRLPGAILAPDLDRVLGLLADEDFARDRPVVVYCSVGWRSSEVGQELIESGRASVFNLDGSIFAWANEGRPLVGGGEVATSRVHPYDRRWGRLLAREKWGWRPDADPDPPGDRGGDMIN